MRWAFPEGTRWVQEFRRDDFLSPLVVLPWMMAPGDQRWREPRSAPYYGHRYIGEPADEYIRAAARLFLLPATWRGKRGNQGVRRRHEFRHHAEAQRSTPIVDSTSTKPFGPQDHGSPPGKFFLGGASIARDPQQNRPGHPWPAPICRGALERFGLCGKHMVWRIQ